MVQENKELLLRDLCARLPYGVKVNEDIQGNFTLIGLTKERIFTTCEVEGCHNDFPIELIKPYLFPLSSMTKEQEDEWYEVFIDPLIEGIDRHTRQEDLQLRADAQAFGLECLLKNHFDIYGLIPMGLAIDATGLNIY